MSKSDSIIDRVSCLSNILQFLRIKDTREKKRNLRIVYINNKKPYDYNGDEPFDYPNNSIKTSKYTIWNFLPKNLFEQFRRVANFYFLLNIIIVFVTPDPPTSPWTSLLPLAIVIAVTAIKQAYEDVLRHKSDGETNNQIIEVLRDNKFIEVKWKDVNCGDIVKVKADETFPCDLVLLYSDTEDGTCSITTANLDGESNLKIRKVPLDFAKNININQLGNLRGVIACDVPNTRLYEFNGRVEIKGKQCPLTKDNILLRGTCLRISPFIYGCVIYAGKDTKMMQNSKFKSNKMSSVERRVNKFIIVFLIILAILTLLCFGLSFIYVNIYNQHWYLTGSEPMFYFSNRDLYNFIVLVFYMNLFNYIIPLSMYVTLELQRFFGTMFLEWDVKLYDEATNQPAKANSSDLNEDLGQIEYLFSDKTGTLTENEMIFKQCFISDYCYEENETLLCKINTKEKANLNNSDILSFFEVLTLCHTVQVDNRVEERYQASSPDEFCFIKFCEKIGIIYEGEVKQDNRLIRQIKYRDKLRRYELLHLLEFDSTRKRMSVIVRCLSTNRILLLCKGAESFLYKKCISNNITKVDAQINEFAVYGWRTLAIAYRVLTEKELSSYDKLLLDAYNDVKSRDERLAEVFEEIESGFTLLGATGIEDRLQEECAETIEALRQAGIKVWILTGDKKETAINISKSCKHLSNDMLKLILTDLNENQIESQLIECLKKITESDKKKSKFALIIDGQTLVAILDDPIKLSPLFLEICLKCDAVLCCRMSPRQKADIVRLVKKSKSKPMTAAIGDGANDVSMIQEANVGIGIYGKEGRNAARSADFAFAKFKYLRRTLLVHGFLYYTRVSILVQYFFYKNLAFVMCQLYYSFFNAFSVQTLFNSIFLTFYNITFTSVPIFLFGLFEQRFEISKIEKNPYLYRLITHNKYLSSSEFLKWSFLGLWHSLCAYFFAYGLYAYSSHFAPSGTLSGYAEFGSLVIMIVFLNVHVKLLLEWHYQTIAVPISYTCSVLAFIVFCLIPNSFIMPSILTSITDNQTFYWIFYDLFSYAATWLCILVAVVSSNLPDFIVSVFETLKERYSTVKYESLESNTFKINSLDNLKKNKIENLAYTNDGYASEKDKGIEIPIDKSRSSLSKQNYYNTKVYYVNQNDPNLTESIVYATFV